MKMANDDLGERSFLGRDFLTWLWFRCEVEGGEFDLPSGDSRKSEPTAVMVEDALSLVSVEEDGSVMKLRKGSPPARPEAASALAAGLTLKKARLLVARGPREWQLTIDGDTLDVSGLKTPSPEQDEAGGGEEKEPPSPHEGGEGETREKKAQKGGDEGLDRLAGKLAAGDEARGGGEGVR